MTALLPYGVALWSFDHSLVQVVVRERPRTDSFWEKSWSWPQVKSGLLCVVLGLCPGWANSYPHSVSCLTIWNCQYQDRLNENISMTHLSSNSLLLGRALSELLLWTPTQHARLLPAAPDTAPRCMSGAAFLLHMMLWLTWPPPGHLSRSGCSPVPSNLLAQASLSFFNLLRWNSHSIKLTVIKRTISWYLAHSQCDVTTTFV